MAAASPGSLITLSDTVPSSVRRPEPPCGRLDAARRADAVLRTPIAWERLGDAFPCHDAISRAGGVIVENLVGLAAVDLEDPWISVLPIHIPEADGAPARAVALQLG